MLGFNSWCIRDYDVGSSVGFYGIFRDLSYATKKKKNHKP